MPDEISSSQMDVYRADAFCGDTPAGGFLRRAMNKEPLRDALDVKTWNRVCNILENLKVHGGWIDRPLDREGKGWVLHIDPHVFEDGGLSPDSDYPISTPSVPDGEVFVDMDVESFADTASIEKVFNSDGSVYIRLKDIDKDVVDVRLNHETNEKEGLDIVIRNNGIIQYAKIDGDLMVKTRGDSENSKKSGSRTIDKTIVVHQAKPGERNEYFSLYNFKGNSDDGVIDAENEKDFLVLAKEKENKEGETPTLLYKKLEVVRKSDNEVYGEDPTKPMTRSIDTKYRSDGVPYFALYMFDNGISKVVDKENLKTYNFLVRKNQGNTPTLEYVKIPTEALMDHVYNVTYLFYDKNKSQGSYVPSYDTYWMKLTFQFTGNMPDAVYWVPIFHVENLTCNNVSPGGKGVRDIYTPHCWLGEDFNLNPTIEVYNGVDGDDGKDGRDGTLFGESGKDNILTLEVKNVTAGPDTTTLAFTGGGTGVNTEWSLAGNIEVIGYDKLLEDVGKMKAKLERLLKDIDKLFSLYEELASRLLTVENAIGEIRGIAKQAADSLKEIEPIKNKLGTLETALSQTNSSLDYYSSSINSNTMEIEMLKEKVAQLEGK